jgi:hypothetical protein
MTSPFPDICRGTVQYTALNEPVTINAIFGKDSSPFKIDQWFCSWYGAADAQGGQVIADLLTWYLNFQEKSPFSGHGCSTKTVRFF